MPKISVIVPVYNAELYLKQCIDSLLEQTIDDIEIILVDDGSSDLSGQICDFYAMKSSKVKTFHQINSGVSVARNKGIDESSGEWITFVDSDDWADPQLCELSIHCAEKNNADLVIFSYQTVYSNKTISSKLINLEAGDVTNHKDYIEKKTISQYYGGNVVNNGVSAGTTWGKIIRKDVLDYYQIRFVPGLTRAQDTVFWINAFERASKIFFLDKQLYFYRITDASICSGTKFIPNCEIPFEKLIGEYCIFINQHYKNSEFDEALYLRKMQVLYWYIKHKFFNDNNNITIHKKVKALKELAKQSTYSVAIKNANTKWLPRGLKLLQICCKYHLYSIYYYLFIFIKKHNKRTEVA